MSRYVMLLSKQIRQAWDKIVKDQTESASYTDLYGKEKANAARMTNASFKKCIKFHLLSQFTFDAGEQLLIRYN